MLRRVAITLAILSVVAVPAAMAQAERTPERPPQAQPSEEGQLAQAAPGQTPPGQTPPGETQPGQVQPAQQPVSPPAEQRGVMIRNGIETRRANPSFFGDTGFWFVPTAEILPAGRFSVSGLRANWDREQGFTDISHFTGTFAYGVADRLELFGSWRFTTRIARRLREPALFQPERPEAGGVVNEYPFVRQGWTGNLVGDLLVGGKVNLLSQGREAPAAFALRGAVLLPTGNRDEGASTGRTTTFLDAIVSGEAAQAIELSAFAGMALRGNPDGMELSNSFRWGAGAGFPTRSPLRAFVELHGENYFDDDVVLTRQIIGVDGSVAPQVSPIRNPIEVTWGIMYQHESGFFVDAGLNWNTRHRPRSDFGPFPDKGGDTLGRQVRIGYHPGVRTRVLPPEAPPPPPPPPPGRPTVKARCEPCTVEIGQESTLTADAQHPDGLPLTYRWTAPTGKLHSPEDRVTRWTAPMQEGPVPITVTVDDGRGGTASDTVTVQVIRPAVKEFVFEDVHFDFDRYSLRPDALRVLDEVFKTLKENPELRIEVEGHTCNIGTAEYNLALGERRAHSVRDYLTNRGVGADRLTTVSYGEERPKHDNAREETRRLNRRAAMVVRVK